ncbi:UbiE/COQ5 family methyltransferase [Aspergillus aurantiobrunneus]
MSDDTYKQVQTRYGDIAKQTSNTNIQDNTEAAIAKAFGYSAADLSSLPGTANLGLSCGNPVAYANMNQGETVVDLGCGGGIDVFLAARKVGMEGKAIGIDMTEEMIALAQKNAEAAGLSNTLFIKARIDSIPLESSSIDCIISNCVINLVPRAEKLRVFREIARLLKPGGRVAISDILARKKLPAAIVNDMVLYVGCIAGASLVAEYREYLDEAGFGDILIVDTNADINLYKQSSYLSQNSCCSTEAPAKTLTSGFSDVDFNEWVGSFQVYAVNGDSAA